MNTYTPEVAAVLKATAELNLAVVNVAIAEAGIVVGNDFMLLDALNEMQHLVNELTRNEVTVNLNEADMRLHIHNQFSTIVHILSNDGVKITPIPTIRERESLGSVITTTIVPNIDTVITESDVVNAEEMGVTSVVLTDTDEATTFHQPVELTDTAEATTLTEEDHGKVAAIMAEANRQAAVRIGDIMTGNTSVSDVQVSSATAHWLNNGAVIPEVESSESGKHGAKRRQRT